LAHRSWTRRGNAADSLYDKMLSIHSQSEKNGAY